MALFTNSNLKKAFALIGFLASSVDAVGGVELGTAGEFAILSMTGVTTTGVTSVTGDIGTSPIKSTAITGFTLIMDSDRNFSTSALVTGKVWAADYVAPTPFKMSKAIKDMQTAFTNAQNRSDTDFTEELSTGNIEGQTLVPGLYNWSTSVHFINSVTFNGSSDSVWILQIAKDLIVGSGARVSVTGGAKAKNIFWQISGATTVGTTAHLEGVFLCKTSIVFKTGSSMNGAALSQTAVTLDAATIVKEDLSVV